MEITPFHRVGTGPPLVLLHGFTDTWQGWRPVLPGLAEHHEVFAPTLPGHHGGPAVPAGTPFTVDDMVDRLEALLDDAGIGTAHLAGNSLGGWLALHLAARGRALSVTGICPAGGWVHGGRDGRRIVRFFVRSHGMLKVGRRAARTVAGRPRLRALALRDVVANPASVSAQAALAMFDGAAGCTIFKASLATARREGLGELAAIDCPVRIAYGTRDRLIRWPACYERFEQLIPNAEVVALEGVGHVPMYDDPALVVSTIVEFTARAEAEAATVA